MNIRCRTCYTLIDEKTGLNLLTERPIRTNKGDYVSLVDMLFVCTSVKALEEDHISQIKERKFIICRSCKSELLKSYSFRVQCLESQKLFNTNNKPNTNVTDDAGKNKYSAIFLIDTDEFKDNNEQVINYDNNQIINCDDDKENFNENTIFDENSLNNDEEDEYCLDEEKDEIKKINDYIKFCAKISGMKEEEVLSIIDNEIPDIGEVVSKNQKIISEKAVKEKLDEKGMEKYKNIKVYKRNRTKSSNTQNDEELQIRQKIGAEELLKEQRLAKEKQEEVDKQIAEYLSKKEKLFPSSTTT